MNVLAFSVTNRYINRFICGVRVSASFANSMIGSFLPNWLTNVVYGGCGIVGAGLALLYVFQEKILYVPHVPGMMKEYEFSPNQAHLRYRDIYMDTSDGIQLHGWIMWDHRRSINTLKEIPTIIFFQANAGNISHRIPFFAEMINALDCCIVTISYRGYGPNLGSPTEKGLKIDAETVLEFVENVTEVEFDQSRIFLFGRSLGGAIAIDLASKNQSKLAGLIVENSFTSIVDMAGCMFPILRPIIGPNRLFNFLVRNKWESKKTIKTLKNIPVLFLASGQDEMVPSEQMTELHKLCPSPKKHHSFFEDAHHMDAFDRYPATYWKAVREFIAAAGKKD